MSAEDIGKLPALRSAKRSRAFRTHVAAAVGRADVISPDPRFRSRLFDNAPERARADHDGDNRAVPFDQYPSEIINQVKSTDAWPRSSARAFRKST